jgi:hypothetical protein
VVSNLSVSELGPLVIHEQAADDGSGIVLVHLQATALVGPKAVEDGVSYIALTRIDLDLFNACGPVGKEPMPTVGQDVLLTKNYDRGKDGALGKQLGVFVDNVLIDFLPGLCAGIDGNKLSLIFMGSPSTVKLLINPLGQTSLHELL